MNLRCRLGLHKRVRYWVQYDREPRWRTQYRTCLRCGDQVTWPERAPRRWSES